MSMHAVAVVYVPEVTGPAAAKMLPTGDTDTVELADGGSSVGVTDGVLDGVRDDVGVTDGGGGVTDAVADLDLVVVPVFVGDGVLVCVAVVVGVAEMRVPNTVSWSMRTEVRVVVVAMPKHIFMHRVA